MKWLNLGALFLAIVWTAFLALGFRTVPAMGPVLEIRSGVWAHRSTPLASRQLKGLKAQVTITFDQFGVPHLFAQNESDLMMAQGFVMASQRLFQMDLMARITAGRLSEWAGPRALKSDLFFVKFGMRESGRKTLERYNRDPRVAEVMSAFASGVNAYIQDLSQLPAEYLILGVKPEPWEPSHIIHMGKQLTFHLAGRSFDHYLSEIQRDLGTAKVLDLFPEFTSLDDIVYPTGAKKLRRQEVVTDFPFVTTLKKIPFFPLPAAGNGSNNWAVSASKSTTGTSIMANDTHLTHTLPNIWYENQLSIPSYNVYGAGLVGIPGIINGMNSRVSWGPTNGTTDVLDYYEVDLGDASLVKSTQQELIHVLGAKSVKVDVEWTKHGVLLHREGEVGLAAVWSGHSSDNELRAVYSLYESRNIDQCLAAFRTWAAPVQNFICVDRNDVALQPSGFLPKRKVGEGRFVMSEGSELQQPIPYSQYPRLVRPKTGYVLSANQRQTGPEFPYYLGWDYEEPFRGAMIRRRLLAKDKLSPEDMMVMQNDSYDLNAELALPHMLKFLSTETLSQAQKDAAQELARWNYQDQATSQAPAIFYQWFTELKAAIFQDEYKIQVKSFLPKDARFIVLLQNLSQDTRHADNHWVDVRETEEVESIQMVTTAAFKEAWSKLQESQGVDSSQWNFKKWIQSSFPHVARLPGFGSDILSVDGGPDTIRGNKGRHGAVYKFVVAHGDWPKAWIQVPGGNEGDPFSREFGRFVEDWAAGKMRPVEFYHNEAEAKSAATRVVELSP
jgi:penicillin amidase